jgi:hypothetical protein
VEQERAAAVPRLEARVRELEIRLLERESEIQDLRARLETQQALLDDAIQEVVRAKAKLLSLESRAEAASQIAETEIALKALEEQGAAGGDPDLAPIRDLLNMSGAEFEKANFGGALYLAIQAKNRIQSVQARLRTRELVEPGSGEVPFAAPVRLTVTRPSNLREQPDMGAPIVARLDSGTPVTGYSHKGEWVRVAREDGTGGWIHQSLVERR